MGTINIQMWQLLLFIAVTWLWGYLFGFFNGKTRGANEILERYLKKKKRNTNVVAEVIKCWKDMDEFEKCEAWSHADDCLKAYYWNSMTDEEKRRYK